MFAIEVEYLLGRSFAGDFRNRSEPEWPPHPSRLFSALVSVYCETDMGEQARNALLWLEKQPSPNIHAEGGSMPEKVTAFVPTNYVESGKKNALRCLPSQRTKQPRTFASVIPDLNTVYFIWPTAEPSTEIRSALTELAARIGYLGTSASFVRVQVSNSAPNPNFVPDSTGIRVFRVPREGRLRELESVYALNRWSGAGPQQGYRQIDESVGPIVPIRGAFGEMIIYRKTSGVRLTVDATLTVSTAIRAAMVKLADEYGVMTDLLHGHGRHPHCAYVPLPFVGHPHSDSSLLGFALVLPRVLADEDRSKILATAGKLAYVNLQEALGVWGVESIDFGSVPSTLRRGTWTWPARRWSTVTPILLDQFPRKSSGVEPTIAASCERQGLSCPTILAHGQYARIDGVPPVPQFRLVRRSSDGPRWAVHATLAFPRPVAGPLLLGAGRYFGMGLLRPLAEEGNR